MYRPIAVFLVVGVLIFSLVTPGQNVSAQVTTLPAQMNKSFSPITIASGGVSRLSVTIFNPNVFQLTNASWIDNLIGIQPGLSIASPVGLTNTCGGTVTAVAGSTTLSLSGGTVPAQSGVTPGSCTVSINVTSTTPGNIINTIPAGALTSTGGGTTISNTTPASATLHVDAIQTPSVTKSFSPSAIWVNGMSQLTIVIRNNDPNITLTQASITDNLPADVFLANPVSSSMSGCGVSASLAATSGGTSVTLNNGSIAPSSTCTITVNVTSTIQGAYTNSIPANSLQTQQGLTNATQATARLNVQALGISKRFSPSTFPAGGTTTLIITLQNPTSTPYTGVNVSDTLPGTALAIVPGSASTTCGSGTVTITLPRTVSLSGGTIPAGTITTPGTCIISVQVTAPAGTPSGTSTNIIPAGALTTNQGVGNLLAATSNVTIAGTDVTGLKSFSPSSIPAGGNSRLRIDILAPFDTNLTNFSITDNLPAGVTVSNSTPPSTSGCGATPPLVLNAPTGAISISLSNGLILAGQRCRIEVYVTSVTPGVYTNTIPPSNITNTENRVPSSNLTRSLTVIGSGNLSIALVKGFNPLTVFGGSASTMSVQLINPNAVPLSGIAFTDNMPNGMILANPLNFDVGTCGGTLSGVSGTTSFSFSGGSLPAFGSCTLTLSATMTVNGNLTNVIPQGAVTTTNGVTNPQPAEASLTNLPGVSIGKLFVANPVVAGSYSTLTITIQNTGNIALSGMGLADTLPGTPPAALEIAGAPAPGAVNTCGGTLVAVPGTQQITLTNGTLRGSSSCSIEVSVIGNIPGNYQNTIPAGAFTSNEGATNGASTTDILVVQANGSGLTKTVTDSDLASTTGTSVAIGEIVTYQASVTIPPGSHANATLMDTLQRGLAFVGCDSITAPGLTTSVAGGFTAICSTPSVSDAGGGTPMDVDRRVTYDFGTLTNGGQTDQTLTIMYRAILLDIATNLDGTNLNNNAVWSSASGALGPAQAQVTIVEPEMMIEKTADVNFIANGSEATFTLTVSHTPASHSDAHDVVLIDVLPAGLDFVANSLDCDNGEQDPDAGTCNYDAGTRTISATWSSFTLLPTGDHGIIQFRVRGNASIPASGSVTNTGSVEWTSLPGDQTVPTSFSSPPNDFATERHHDPASLIGLYGDTDSLTLTPVGSGGQGTGQGTGGGRNNSTSTSSATAQNAFLIPLTGFAPNIETKLDTADRPLYTNMGLMLDIPVLKVNAPIAGVEFRNGYWNVDWLQDQAGWLDGTAYPTWNGNSVLMGHAINADGKPGIFSKLKALGVGEYIFVYNSGYRYVYKVVSNQPVKPNDIRVLKHEEKAYLTLITCDKYDIKSATYLYRIVVRAVLVDVQPVK